MTAAGLYVPCPHEMTGEKCGRRVPDHQPLNREEVILLLNAYRGAAELPTRDRASARGRIQMRFAQAIPGMTCPYPVAPDPMGRKLMDLTELVYERGKEGAADDLVDAIMALIA